MKPRPRRARVSRKRKEGELWEQFVYRTTTDPKVDPDRKAVRPLSPSSLSKYVACPLRFYYEAICRYREEDSPSLLLASNEFGTVLHRVMEEFYSDLTKSPSTGDQLTFTTITKEMIDEKLRAKGYIRQRVEKAYRDELKLKQGVPLSGLSRIYCQTIERYARELLEWDSAHAASFNYAASESEVYAAFTLPSGATAYLGGIIDRIDQVDGKYRVVDYKTGNASLTISKPQKKVVDFRWEERLKDPKNKAILQTLIYCAGLAQTYKLNESQIHPAIFRFKGNDGLVTKQKKYDPLLTFPIGEKQSKVAAPYAEVKESFEALLVDELLAELYDTDKPFTQTEDDEQCAYCPFALSCGR